MCAGAASEFWQRHYMVRRDAQRIARHLRSFRVASAGDQLELLSLERARSACSVLISQGSGGPGHIFLELAEELYERRFNVFIMPKHGGRTVSELVVRHCDVLEGIRRAFNDRIGVYSEGLGGFVSFYAALAGGAMKSLICENSPAIMSELGHRDPKVTVGVAHVESQGYRIEAKGPATSATLFTMWLSGECYAA